MSPKEVVNEPSPWMVSEMTSKFVTVSCRGVTKAYGETHALRGVDLEVREGEIFGFLGSNGAGKTTLIRCLLDMIRPDGGYLQVLGKCPQKESVAVRRATGYLPGELHLDASFTVRQALNFFRRLRPNPISWDQVETIAERLRLEFGRSIKNLSKGNKQKLGVIQAFMHEPPFLLLDEPTSGLDPLMQQEVLNMVREARNRGATVLFSSHHLAETHQVADRVAMIRDGVVVACEAPHALVTNDVTRVRILLKREISADLIESVPQLKVIQSNGGREWTIDVEGDLDPLLEALSGHGVRRLEPEEAKLDEMFFTHYRAG